MDSVLRNPRPPVSPRKSAKSNCDVPKRVRLQRAPLKHTEIGSPEKRRLTPNRSNQLR